MASYVFAFNLSALWLEPAFETKIKVKKFGYKKYESRIHIDKLLILDAFSINLHT